MRDIETLTEFSLQLAHETEDLQLDAARVRAGVEALVRDSAKGLYFVAEANENVVGQLFVTYEWSDWRNGNYWWIQSVYVDKSSRGQGIFRSLYAHVVTEAKKAGNVCGIKLYVEGDNVTAQRSYLSLGMQKADYQVFERIF